MGLQGWARLEKPSDYMTGCAAVECGLEKEWTVLESYSAEVGQEQMSVAHIRPPDLGLESELSS